MFSLIVRVLPNCNNIDCINQSYQNGETPLNRAKKGDHLLVVQFLLSEGAKVDGENKVKLLQLLTVVVFNN